jgi:oxygen-independent coproporphyrinogen-3 oxidase
LPGDLLAPRILVPPPLSLYVHLPWCLRKCPYCDFNSHELRGELPERAYLDALIRDLETALPEIWGRPVISIFFGGGTPSLFSAAAIDELISRFRALLPLAADCEITLEANPGTFEREKFRAFRAAGVNRLSIGVQSFSNACLRALGRVHDGTEAHQAVTGARHYFDDVNVDLMYGLPHQTPQAACGDVSLALELGATHISAYQLTLEPNTLFARYPPVLPAEEQLAAIEHSVHGRLADAGFVRYEVSAFAPGGRQCRHNRNYWEFGDYLGIGAGAHGKLSFAESVRRDVRIKHPRDYLTASADFRSQSAAVVAERLPFEFMLNTLRLTNGVDSRLFTERCGAPLSVLTRPLQQAYRRGLIEESPDRFQATALGYRFLNDLVELFLPNTGVSQD